MRRKARRKSTKGLKS